MNIVNEQQNAHVEQTSNEPANVAKSSTSAIGYFSVLLIGMALGIVFVKSEVANWQRVNDMFMFKEAHMYLIICVGVIVAMISMALIKQFEAKTIEGKPIKYKPKPYHKGVILGGMIFGAGWAITGACPGPIYAQIGGGELLALVTFTGAMLGMFAFAYLKPKLPF